MRITVVSKNCWKPVKSEKGTRGNAVNDLPGFLQTLSGRTIIPSADPDIWPAREYLLLPCSVLFKEAPEWRTTNLLNSASRR